MVTVVGGLKAGMGYADCGVFRAADEIKFVRIWPPVEESSTM
jgi:hypothetical protein